jgi:hypothetical protein
MKVRRTDLSEGMTDASLDPTHPDHSLLMAIGMHIGGLYGLALEAGKPGDPAEISDEGIARLSASTR